MKGSTKNQLRRYLRLFLRPDHLFQIGHALQALDQRLAGEGIKLFDADDGGISSPAALRASIRS
jgi:hypothetical protein